MRPTVVLVLVAALVSVTADAPAHWPRLSFGDPAPDDLRAVVAAAWSETLASLPAHRRCMADVTVRGAWGLSDRARYLPDERTVVVQLPNTAGQLRGSLVHEFAHHLEATCPAHRDLRPAFLQAQGHPPTASWFDADDWESTPSEQFAEAMVLHVLGTRLRNTQLTVAEEAVAALAEWAGASRGQPG